MQSETTKKPIEKHHIQEKLCETRPAYRQGKKLTAVKIYTINSESQHLYIYGVPKINLRSELKSLCMKYGPIKTIRVVSDVETEMFTECFHVQYERLQSARIAKRVLDGRSFYGSLLHVCYAPEHESLSETRAKLDQRKLEVTRKMNQCNFDTHETRNTWESQNSINQNEVNSFNNQILTNNLYNNEGINKAEFNCGNSEETVETYKNIEESNSINSLHKSIGNKQNRKPKRNYTDFPNIYEADDPILAKRVRLKNVDVTINKDSGVPVYGPSIEDFQNKSDVTPVFIPAPVVKSNLNVCAKRIVFKKKEFGLNENN